MEEAINKVKEYKSQQLQEKIAISETYIFNVIYNRSAESAGREESLVYNKHCVDDKFVIPI